ncbi:hypothetical protein Aduo_008137 [Ancylostoma duodenale]
MLAVFRKESPVQGLHCDGIVPQVQRRTPFIALFVGNGKAGYRITNLSQTLWKEHPTATNGSHPAAANQCISRSDHRQGDNGNVQDVQNSQNGRQIPTLDRTATARNQCILQIATAMIFNEAE